MGIVRDITVDQLKQAVNNIDTSTLAQDSTLQAVVTAINNISGGSDPVTNTTVNTLGKDTTLQSIAAAISALGTALGSDKANISGDNIADKVTFKNNIGLEIKTKNVTGTTNAYGILNLGLAWDSNEIIAVRDSKSASTGRFCLVFVFGNNYCVRVLNDASNYLPAANTSVTLNVRYREV